MTEPNDPDRDCYDCDRVGCPGCGRNQQATARAAALLIRTADLITQRATDLWRPGSPAHTEMLADADELRRLAEECQQPETEPTAYNRTAWETYRRDAGCACTSPDPTSCAVNHRPGPWMCVCHRLSAELTDQERSNS